ncbi:Cytochrome-b5 reductase [Fasciola gigantica]|uniref:Cytochrome-b5 reductase n=1 Tax=Fasciola gigantica TaxID=46835 RepID=A0A504YIB6_FASGI|nr:Cytochrome-b5 reductase [Fasciola gigantica]
MSAQSAKFSWEEIEKHSSVADRWIVLEKKVYDVTKWQNRHPGGRKIIGHYATQDATEAFLAFHKDIETTKKFLKPYYIGDVDLSDLDPKREDFLARREQFVKDFEDVRSTMHELVGTVAALLSINC